MRMYCDDCGCPAYDGECTNCHEVLYIERQYEELSMEKPEPFVKECVDARDSIIRKNAIKAMT